MTEVALTEQKDTIVNASLIILWWVWSFSFSHSVAEFETVTHTTDRRSKQYAVDTAREVN